MENLIQNYFSGSIKVRAASHIIHDAIKSGKLKSETRQVIEATSGNFGIALGLNIKTWSNSSCTCFKKITRRCFQRIKK